MRVGLGLAELVYGVDQHVAGQARQLLRLPLKKTAFGVGVGGRVAGPVLRAGVVAARAAFVAARRPEGAVSTDTNVSWGPVPGAAAYLVRWRRTDASNWQHVRRVAADTRTPIADSSEPAGPNSPARLVGYGVPLEGIRVDDWVFGVSSVSADGFESPVASAVPGGAFKPWVKPPATN